jgi:hypothetical protein
MPREKFHAINKHPLFNFSLMFFAMLLHAQNIQASLSPLQATLIFIFYPCMQTDKNVANVYHEPLIASPPSIIHSYHQQP